MSKQNIKLILIGCFFFTLPYWIKPVYESVHEKSVRIGVGKGDKVALYVDANAISDTFKTNEALDISEDSPGNAYRGAIMKVYPVYLRYKKGNIYYLSYPVIKNGEPTLKTNINAKNVHTIDFYFRDEIQLSLGVKN